MTYPRQITSTPQTNAPAILNGNLKAIEHAATFANDDLASSGLLRAYHGGSWGDFDIADFTHTFGASTTTYVSVEIATGDVDFSTSTTNWLDTTNYVRVEIVITDASAVTDVTNRRGGPGGVHGGGGGVAAGGGLLAANNLSDVANAATARSNLGLGTAATQASSAFEVAGAAATAQTAAQAYADALVAGLSWKQAVRAATTAAGTLASSFENGDTIDGVVLATGDRILIKNQSSGAENGIYVVAASGAPTRATDADSGAELVNASVYVSEGTTLADTQWTCTTNKTITVGSTSLAFAQLATGGASPTTTKGDLAGYSTVSARIPVGANGLNLEADSTQTLGVKWAHVFGWFNVKVYGALGDGRRVVDGVANSTSTVTSATAAFVPGDVGKVLEINNGTTTYVSTISTYNSATSVTLAGSVTFTATACEIYFGTDDTTAIQAAITAAAAAGVNSTVYGPPGIYLNNGALQDTSRSNAQIIFPSRDISGTGTVVEPYSITIKGASAPAAMPYVLAVTGLPVPVQGTIFKSTLNTASGTAPCFLGGWGPSTSFGNFTNVRVVLRNLIVRMPRNPALTAVDLSRVVCCDVNYLNIDAGSYDVPNIATQTTSASYGFKAPANGNGANTQIGEMKVVGFYNGYSVAEHFQGRAPTAWGCQNAFVFVAADHSSRIQRAGVYHCKNGLVFTGGQHSTDVTVNYEHAASGTWTTTYDVSDASNYARGSLIWHTVLAGTGSVDTLLVNGALYFKRQHLLRMGAAYALPYAATVTIDCNITDSFRLGATGNFAFANPTTPYDGQVINVRIIQDGTGSRTWTLGSKFKFAGGAPLLSTAASAKDFVSCQYDATDDTWNCAISKAMA